jgi:predicted transcriptional regulator
MDIQSEKLSLLQDIINTDDAGLIKDLKFLISSRDFDWFNDLDKNQQKDVKEGIRQLDQGESFSHEDAKKRFNA